MRFYEADVRGSTSTDDLLERVGKLAKKRKTTLVVLDDLHALGNGSTGTAANQVKYLSEVLDSATFLCTINTGSDCAVLDQNKGGDQIRKRGSWHSMKPYNSAQKEWLSVLSKFERLMPWCTEQRTQTKDHAALLHDITEGRTGILATFLRDITTEMIETNTDGEDLLTEELITYVAKEMVTYDLLAA